MANRVNVNITARDLTRGELGRIRRNFNALGQDVNRAVGNRTRANFNRLSQSVNQSRRDLMAMRGSIPDAEFFRLDEALRRSQRRLQRGFGNVGNRAFARIVADLRQVNDGFRDLDDNSQIRVRVDNAALRRADARLRQWQRQQDARIRASQNAILRADRRLAAGLRTRDGDSSRVRVRVDPDASGFGPRLRRVLMAPLRQAGRVAGGILSDGIGQGIVAGFQSAGPVGIAVFAAMLATVVSMIGAALGGILVFAFGAAVVGIAGIMASKSEEVKDAWKDTIESIKEDFKGAGKPMEEVLLKGMELLEEMSADFAPHFKKAVEEAVPHVLIFQQKISEGIRRFGEIAFEPLMLAFNELLDSLGPEMVTFFEHLGEAFAYLAEAVTENSDEVALAIRYVLEIVTGLVYVLGALVHAWAWVVRNVEFASAALQVAWGWVDRNWDVTITATQTGIDSITILASDLWNIVDRNWIRNVLFSAPGLRSVTGLVSALWGWVNRNWKRVVAFSAPGLSSAIEAVRTLWGWVNRSWSRTVSLSVSMPGLSAAKAGLKALGFAHGGVRGISTAATGGVRNNMTLVGEHGPELVDLAPGSRVRSNPDTRRLMGGQGGGGGGGTFVFKSSGRRVDDMLIEILREAIHQRGGDPITVLGG